MIHFIKIYFWILVPLLLISGVDIPVDPYKTIQHKIEITHPGEKEAVTIILIQNIDENGLPISYYMDVQSVICLEKVCKIIPVRIFWNDIGEYQKYELEEGATLEKYEDAVFESQDYLKLQTILANVNSPFKDVFIDEILTVVDKHSDEDTDAVSGATALELDEKDTVPGAALTCFTLWHWANGDIVQKIKEITGESVSEQQLKVFLVDENQAYFKIALHDLERRKNYTTPFIKVITKRVLEEEILLKSTFAYIEKAPANIYFSATEEVFVKGKTAQKLAAIRSLKLINYKVSSSYLDRLSNQIPKLSSYQEVSFFLDVIQAKNPISKKVVENVLPLLKSDFITARRAYWFLKNQQLSATQKELLQNFEKENKSSL
ncbi:hypothetical protein [Polaribacter sp. Q13]|uniref:hypothetical protein n=1 Tax=Polaribacter sp. Q13 TaxID=2806551 RepID=UPI00193B561E|nr:hypothetical protein [Polaribacter sp. Q13]QVY65630.1 hypothetical protein JOP69_18165 [Polaribacter sp. Q13]